MSHESKEGETQGTGFFGIKDGCRELSGQDIPERFRLLSADLRSPVYGTSLSIAGFLETSDWRRRIASSVIENFFYAVHQGNLKVLIDPDQTLTDLGLLEIDDASLGKWFDYLEENVGDSEDSGDEGGSALKQARAFWQISDDGNLPIEKQDVDLGHCRLWIRVEEGLPSKVAFVRRTGMLVTTEQNGLIRFPGFQDFAAMCVFEDPQGNELLRRMENPQHNKFEPDRLPEGERRRGRRALKRITDWIRSEVRKAAGPPEGGASTVLSELAAYLPDDEPFEDAGHDGEGTEEPGFGDRVKLTLKPVRRPTPPVLNTEDEESEEGEGDGEDTGSIGGAGTGTNGGEGGNGGPGDGDGEGGTGGRGGGQVRFKRIPISNVRILSIEGRDNCYRLSFRANGSGVVRLNLEEAGDSSAIRREDVRSLTDNVSLDHFTIVDGERTELEITADSPIGGRAWRLSAVEAKGD